MMGTQHKSFALPFSAMFAAILIGILGFGFEYLLVIPIGYYFSVWCDIDQNIYAPKETRRAKALWETLLWLIPSLSGCILGYFGYNYYKNIPIPEENYKYIGMAAGVLIASLALNFFLKSKWGTFFRKHRGFTHTLIVPILLVVLYTQLGKMNVKPQHEILVKAISILIAGLFAGLTSHIFLDGTNFEGVPLLWPIYRKNIHWGNSKTSDPKKPGKAHKSSIRSTRVWSFVCIVLTGLIIWKYYPNILFQLKHFKF